MDMLSRLGYSPSLGQRASMRALVARSISMMAGQGRGKPSACHLRGGAMEIGRAAGRGRVEISVGLEFRRVLFRSGQRASMRALVARSISMMAGQGRVKPSACHLRVASM